jgi:hypothetical protein
MESQPLDYASSKKPSVRKGIRNFISRHKKSLLATLAATVAATAIGTSESFYASIVGEENTWRVNRVIPLWGIKREKLYYSIYLDAPVEDGYLRADLFHLYNESTRIAIDKDDCSAPRGHRTYFELKF